MLSEALEAERKRQEYWRLHAAGKTDEAKADLKRLEQVRREREEAVKKRAAEKAGARVFNGARDVAELSLTRAHPIDRSRASSQPQRRMQRPRNGQSATRSDEASSKLGQTPPSQPKSSSRRCRRAVRPFAACRCTHTRA